MKRADTQARFRNCIPPATMVANPSTDPVGTVEYEPPRVQKQFPANPPCSCTWSYLNFDKELLRLFAYEQSLLPRYEQQWTEAERRWLVEEYSLPALPPAIKQPKNAPVLIKPAVSTENEFTQRLALIWACPLHSRKAAFFFPGFGRLALDPNFGIVRIGQGTIDVIQRAHEEAEVAELGLRQDLATPVELRAAVGRCHRKAVLHTTKSVQQAKAEQSILWSHLATIWSRCQAAACPLCETDLALGRMYRFLYAADHQRTYALPNGRIWAARLPTPDANQYRSGTTWARLTDWSTEYSWLLYVTSLGNPNPILKPHSFEMPDFIYHYNTTLRRPYYTFPRDVPQTLWDVYRPPAVWAYAPNGAGWSDARLQARIGNLWEKKNFRTNVARPFPEPMSAEWMDDRVQVRLIGYTGLPNFEQAQLVYLNHHQRYVAHKQPKETVPFTYEERVPKKSIVSGTGERDEESWRAGIYNARVVERHPGDPSSIRRGVAQLDDERKRLTEEDLRRMKKEDASKNGGPN
jgi:hypothetical protein